MFSSLGLTSLIILAIPHVPWSFLPQSFLMTVFFLNCGHPPHEAGFSPGISANAASVMSIFFSRCSRAVQPSTSAPLLMFFSWTIYLSVLICKMERYHLCTVRSAVFVIHRLLLLLSSHFSFAVHGPCSLIMPLQYELVSCNLKIYRFRTFGLIMKGTLLDSLYQIFLSNLKKKGCLTSFHFQVQFLSSPFFLGDYSYYFLKNYVHGI